MRVLLVEGRAGDGDGAEALLRSSGHEVSRCADRGAEPFPCKGMLSGDCPLDHEVIDAAVLVRGAAGGDPSPSEDGARCALRRHVPLVLAGEVQDSPYAEFATDTTTEIADLPGALARATAAILDRHTRAARRSLQAVLVQHELDASGAEAEVHRVGSELRVALRPGLELPKQVADMAAVRAAGAIRDVDPYASKVDVSVEGLGETVALRAT